MNDWKKHPKLRCWVTEPLASDVAQSLLKLANADDVYRVTVMPDVHLASDICIGTVLATHNLIYPAAVGGDIGCGMAALPLHGSAKLLRSERSAAKILDRLYQRVPAIRHASKTTASLPQDLQSQPLSHPALEKLKHRDGRVQLGTLGRGNHFLEFQADADDGMWLMVHSGSRGMGQAINAHHVANADVGRNRLKFLAADDVTGQAYLNDVGWAMEYAQASRAAMLRSVVELLGELFGIDADESSMVDRHHNHVVRETHCSEELIVHRKGAQAARAGEACIVPGSMATNSYIVEGRGNEESLQSCSHGAGRKRSRSRARSTITVKQLHQQMGRVWFDHRRAKTLVDEAPAAYKDIAAVMRAQNDLVRIVHELQPLLSYKA